MKAPTRKQEPSLAVSKAAVDPAVHVKFSSDQSQRDAAATDTSLSAVEEVVAHENIDKTMLSASNKDGALLNTSLSSTNASSNGVSSANGETYYRNDNEGVNYNIPPQIIEPEPADMYESGSEHISSTVNSTGTYSNMQPDPLNVAQPNPSSDAAAAARAKQRAEKRALRKKKLLEDNLRTITVTAKTVKSRDSDALVTISAIEQARSNVDSRGDGSKNIAVPSGGAKATVNENRRAQTNIPDIYQNTHEDNYSTMVHKEDRKQDDDALNRDIISIKQLQSEEESEQDDSSASDYEVLNMSSPEHATISGAARTVQHVLDDASSLSPQEQVDNRPPRPPRQQVDIPPPRPPRHQIDEDALPPVPLLVNPSNEAERAAHNDEVHSYEVVERPLSKNPGRLPRPTARGENVDVRLEFNNGESSDDSGDFYEMINNAKQSNSIKNPFHVREYNPTRDAGPSDEDGMYEIIDRSSRNLSSPEAAGAPPKKPQPYRQSGSKIIPQRRATFSRTLKRLGSSLIRRSSSASEIIVQHEHMYWAKAVKDYTSSDGKQVTEGDWLQVFPFKVATDGPQPPSNNAAPETVLAILAKPKAMFRSEISEDLVRKTIPAIVLSGPVQVLTEKRLMKVWKRRRACLDQVQLKLLKADADGAFREKRTILICTIVSVAPCAEVGDSAIELTCQAPGQSKRREVFCMPDLESQALWVQAIHKIMVQIGCS